MQPTACSGPRARDKPHRRMTRVFGPGCYYGGIPKPQLLQGTQLPWAYQGNYFELEGAIPVYKLHGSLNWSRAGDGLELFQDRRPAFRGGGDAAIIPPVPEKEIPAWLRPVWSGAEEELARAEAWTVCGYSLPSYDVAITELLRRAATAGIWGVSWCSTRTPRRYASGIPPLSRMFK